MQHNELTPLLLMREELQPRPSCKATLYTQQARTTIVHSPLYNKAIQMFYSDSESPTYLPSPRTPPLNAHHQVLPTPPQTIQRAGLGPSLARKLEHPSLSDASDHSDGSRSSATPPPFILPDPNAIDAAQRHVIPSYQLDPDSSDELEGIAEDTRLEIEAEVIVIDSDDSNSDQETSQVSVPFLLVVWTTVCLYS
jgi:hypothetical protein